MQPQAQQGDGGNLVVGTHGGAALSHWQLDGTLRARVPCSASCVYAIAVNRSAGCPVLFTPIIDPSSLFSNSQCA